MRRLTVLAVLSVLVLAGAPALALALSPEGVQPAVEQAPETVSAAVGTVGDAGAEVAGGAANGAASFAWGSAAMAAGAAFPFLGLADAVLAPLCGSCGSTQLITGTMVDHATPYAHSATDGAPGAAAGVVQTGVHLTRALLGAF